MIFVSGIHGVGKSYFCNMVDEKLGIKSYSASQLISQKKFQEFAADKLVPDIIDNQLLLIESVNELRRTGEAFILDGHFCLLDEKGEITRVQPETYASLAPDAIILLMEEPDIIAGRRLKRDKIKLDVSQIAAFQEAEKEYAIEIAKKLSIPLEISKGSRDLERLIEFVKNRGNL